MSNAATESREDIINDMIFGKIPDHKNDRELLRMYASRLMNADRPKRNCDLHYTLEEAKAGFLKQANPWEVFPVGLADDQEVMAKINDSLLKWLFKRPNA